MRRIDFNSGWTCNGEAVTLPHDAMIHAARSAEAPSTGAGAYFEGGVYEYRKQFEVPGARTGKRVLLQFEGVYRNPSVRVNGAEVGGCAYGYVPFFCDVTGALRPGEPNVVEVTVHNEDHPSSRWYSGGGIYRPAWLWVCEEGGLVPEGVRVRTVSIEPACVVVEAPAGAGVEILDARGAVVAQGGPGELEVSNACLWSDETPHLYTCRVSLGGEVWCERFGIRTVEVRPGKGLFVNGRETLLRGGCIHHDNGILGAATHREAEFRRARMLKEAGYNALRMSHNPASAAMLDACDELGLFVMDEMWDMWYSGKNPADYSRDFMDGWESDVEATVARDYNHPSVILYSIGNEVSEPATPRGMELARRIIAKFHGLDATRPVTGGMNLMIMSRAAKGDAVYAEDGSGRDDSGDKSAGGMNSLVFNMITNFVGSGMNKAGNSKKVDELTTPVLDALDIAGYNYASGRYPLEGKAHPKRVIFGSETFPQDLPKNWAMVEKYPYLVGDFMWTAWDYLGEAGGGAWAYTPDGRGFQKPYPWLLADMGAYDILGNPTGELFWAQAVWHRLKEPAICVQPANHPGVRPAKSSWRGTNALPGWSWAGCEGNKCVVEVYFDCACVELLLNGGRLGRKRVRGCRAVFKTRYQPGVLEAVAYDAAGRELARRSVQSAGSADIQVVPEFDAGSLRAGDVVYYDVFIGDANGLVERNADCELSCSVEGGELLGFGSANPRTEERFDAGRYATYYGQAQAVVRVADPASLKLSVVKNGAGAKASAGFESRSHGRR